MAEIILDYSEIKDAYRAAGRAADRCTDYAEDLKGKVTAKLGELTLGATGSTGTACSYMNDKISELQQKAAAYTDFSENLEHFLNDGNGAKQADKKAANEIKDMNTAFCKKNGIEVNAVVDFFTYLSTAISNTTEFGQWLNQVFTDVGNWLDDLGDAIKYWYKCEGGDYVIKIVVTVVLVVAAVAVVIVAAPAAILAASSLIAAIQAGAVTAGVVWAAMTSGATLLTAIITMVDAATNLTFNVKACMVNGEDPAWARRYDSYNTIAGFLEKNKFDTSGWNKVSYFGADFIQGIQFVCSTINIANLAKNGFQFCKQLKSGDAFWKKIRFTTPSKKPDVKNGITWPTFQYGWNGVKQNFNSIKNAVNADAFKSLAAANYSWVRKAKSFGDAIKPLKSISTVVLNIQEKGFGAAITNYLTSKSTVLRGLSSFKKSASNIFD